MTEDLEFMLDTLNVLVRSSVLQNARHDLLQDGNSPSI